MKKKLLFTAFALGIVLGTAALWWHWRSVQEASTRAIVEAGMQRQQQAAEGSSHLPGDDILKNYALPATRPQEDLEALAHTFSNLFLLVKGDAPFHMGANEEFAAALRGKNRAKLRFLSDGHRALNARSQLVDRWGTPLHFHVVAHDRVDIRSAGPDRQMWTEDDLHRQHDGTFLKGKSLNPPSLLKEPAPGRRR
ncbi:hypothetical protein WJU23_12885 [Prosthecobacter sp. SYSU 5D2]|uniref:hypothetical protein n=1 Tax=Prosthecobacter sp. SYSU 5D2 TaxID=3134134 RepID=UPI0031FE9ACD